MATLKIWNIEDNLVLSDTSETIESLEYLLASYKDYHGLDSSGGPGYDIKISIYNDLLMLRDELEDYDGFVVGRYELRV